MVCVKRLILPLCVCIALLGCGAQQPKEQTDAVDSTSSADAFQPISNPYLSEERKVPSDAQAAFESALLSIESEDWSVAQAQLEQMTQQYPNLSGSWVNLGIVFWRQQQYELAADAFQQAIVVNPLNNDAYVQFAVMQRERGLFAEAEQLYLQALEVWPHNLEAIVNLGILYDMYMGRFDDALKQFELAQKIHQANGEPDQQLAGWIIDIKRRQNQ